MIADWRAVLQNTFDCIPDVATWNANIAELKRLADIYGAGAKSFIAAEAQRRGYIWATLTKEYCHPWDMRACNYPGRIIGVGWRSGQLATVFAGKDGKPVRYESVRHDVPEETMQKLVRSAYPDALYKKLIVDKQIKMQKVG
jgi:hypothetical protein